MSARQTRHGEIAKDRINKIWNKIWTQQVTELLDLKIKRLVRRVGIFLSILVNSLKFCASKL